MAENKLLMTWNKLSTTENKLVKFFVQGVKFGLVGILNTLITMVVFYLLNTLLGVWYIIANPIAYTVGFTNSYIMNRIWTFKSKGSVKEQSIPFLLVFGTCFLLQWGLSIFLKEYIGMSVNLATIIAMAFYMVINFLGHKYITFKA